MIKNDLFFIISFMNICGMFYGNIGKYFLLFLVFFYGWGSVSAETPIITDNGGSNCNLVQEADFENGYKIKHYTLQYGRDRNIGRTELYLNQELIDIHDNVFYSSGWILYYFSGSLCSIHSKIGNISMQDGLIQMSYDYFNPRSNSSVTQDYFDTKKVYFNVHKKNISDISASIYAFSSAIHNYITLHLQSNNIGENVYIASSGFSTNIINKGGATTGTTLSSSTWYSQQGCSITEVVDTEENYEVHYDCKASYHKSESVINGSAQNIYRSKTGVFLLSKEDYDLCDYDEQLCSTTIPTPTLLTQQIQSPNPGGEALEREEVDVGASVGTFQSGSGMILGASIESETPTDYLLRVNVYLRGETQAFTFNESTFNSTGSGEMTIPNLPVGEYYWTAQVVDVNDSDNFSEVVQFGENIFLNTDFEIFGGFEPYPYSYNFVNSSVDKAHLTGGIEKNTFLGFTIGREIKPGTKWDIFYEAFDTSKIDSNEKKLMDAFESFGLDQEDPNVLGVGSCYGLSLSALMQLDYPDFLQNHYTGLSQKIGNDNIWNSIDVITTSNSKWNALTPEIESILSMHLSQKSILAQEYLDTNGISDLQLILDTILNNPSKNYILALEGQIDQRNIGHVVVPYRIEGNKIFVWDNETPYSSIEGTFSYNQIIDIDVGNDTWNNQLYTWDVKGKLTLIDIEDLYNNGSKSTPIGFNETDSLFSFFGNADIIVTDEVGRISGFQDGDIIEEIPGVKIVIDYNSSIIDTAPDNTWKQIYLPQKQDLMVKITGNTEESYDLMIAGGDYYTKVENVETSPGQIDTFIPTGDSLEINFDDTKTGDYNLLVDNFQNNGTGTIYVDTIEVVTEAQKYSIDWTKVVANTSDALTYETDIDTDGTYDTIISVSAISTGEDLIEEEIEISDYIYSSKTISYQSGQQTAISSYYSIVGNFPDFNWGEHIPFTTSGEGSPTVKMTSGGRAGSGALKSGANIRMDIPPAGESYTAYLHIPGYTLEFTTSKDAPPPSDVGTLDFGIKTVNYGGIATSNWVNFPYLSEDTEFTLTGEGNPSAQTVNGQRSDNGLVRWGTNIKAEIPEPGETRVIEFTILGQAGTFTIIRQ